MHLEDIFSIKSKTILLTGAASGLGREFAHGLTQVGAHVVLLDRQKEKLEKVAQELQSEEILPIACDVTKKEDIQMVIQQTHQKFGHIDVLINCAGILGSDRSMLEIDEEEWDQVLSVNLKGTWMMSKFVAIYMIEHQIHGKIINISSSLGKRAQLKRCHYASSKAAVEHLTRNMAMELVDHHISVNCLAPGWVETEMVKSFLSGDEGERWRKTIPMHRAAKPNEILGALILLASNASSYMTGSVIRLDGGYTYVGIE